MPAVRVMLTLADREEISRGLAEGLEYKQIAVLIGRNPSVVSRDVARHGGRAGYRAVAADQSAVDGRQRPKAYAVDRSPRLRTVVTELLGAGWSPASIAGRLPHDYRGDQAERVSRFVVLVPLSGRDALTVGDAVIAAAGTLPPQIARSLTWDCGAEMAGHARITAAGLPVYFARPHSPWQRGGNENANRILREYFPKGVPITADPTYLAMVASEINDRPRKIHNWKKPSEIFAELVEANASTL